MPVCQMIERGNYIDILKYLLCHAIRSIIKVVQYIFLHEYARCNIRHRNDLCNFFVGINPITQHVIVAFFFQVYQSPDFPDMVEVNDTTEHDDIQNPEPNPPVSNPEPNPSASPVAGRLPLAELSQQQESAPTTSPKNKCAICTI